MPSPLDKKYTPGYSSGERLTAGAKEILIENKVMRGVRAFISAFIGIPTAAAATCLVGATLAVAEIAKYGERSLRVNFGETKAVDNPTLVALTDALEGAIKTTWSQWGVFPYTTAAVAIQEAAEGLQNSMGYGYSDSDDKLLSDSEGKRVAKEKRDRSSQQIWNSIFNLDARQFQEWLDWIEASPKKLTDKSAEKWITAMPETMLDLLTKNKEALPLFQGFYKEVMKAIEPASATSPVSQKDFDQGVERFGDAIEKAKREMSTVPSTRCAPIGFRNFGNPLIRTS